MSTRWIVRMVGLLFILVGAFLLPVQPACADAEIDFIDTIQQRGYLTVGLPPYESPPAYYIDSESQELEGFDVELVRGLAQALGVGVQFDRESTSFNDLVARVGRNEFDMAIGKLGKTYQRLVDAFPIQYLHLRHALLVNRQFIASLAVDSGHPSFGHVLSQSPMRIGSIADSTWQTGVGLHFPNSEFVGFTDWDSAQAALVEDRGASGRSQSVDAIYRDLTEIKKIIYRDPVLTLDFVPVVMDDVFEDGSIFLSQAGYEAFSAFVPFYLDAEWGEIKSDQDILEEFSSYYFSAS